MWWGVAGGRRRSWWRSGPRPRCRRRHALDLVASLTPAKQRPYPVGSRNGSIYAAVFVYNGVERLNGTSAQVAPVGSASPPGSTRLLGSEHPFYGPRIGLELIAAIALGLGCGLAGLRRARVRVRLPRLRGVGPRRAGTATAAPGAPERNGDAPLRAGRLSWWPPGRRRPLRPNAARAVLYGGLHPIRRTAMTAARPLAPATMAAAPASTSRSASPASASRSASAASTSRSSSPASTAHSPSRRSGLRFPLTGRGPAGPPVATEAPAPPTATPAPAAATPEPEPAALPNPDARARRWFAWGSSPGWSSPPPSSAPSATSSRATSRP